MILVKIKETTEAFGADAEKAHAVQPVRRRLIGTMVCVFRRQVPSSRRYTTTRWQST